MAQTSCGKVHTTGMLLLAVSIPHKPRDTELTMSTTNTDSSLAMVVLAFLAVVGYGIYQGYRAYDAAYGTHEQVMQVAVKGWQVGEIRSCWVDMEVLACTNDWDVSDVKTFNVRFKGNASRVFKHLGEPKAECTRYSDHFWCEAPKDANHSESQKP